MRFRNAVLAVICACASQQLVMAHPGHTVQPDTPHTLTHYLTHPDHLAQWLVVAIAIAFAVIVLKKVKRPAQAVATAAKRWTNES